MLWLMLVVGVGLGWWTESARARQWRQRAEVAAGQLEVEKLGKMAFEDSGVSFESNNFSGAFKQAFYPTDKAR
jgi:hypothetical protein